MFFKTKTYCYHTIKNYSYNIYYYDVNIYLNRLNNKRKKLKRATKLYETSIYI